MRGQRERRSRRCGSRPWAAGNGSYVQRISTMNGVLAERLDVMDATAIVMCRDNDMPLRVFDMTEPGALVRVIQGEPLGTLIVAETE